ncbi:MAG TPA: hypothetical protein VEJ18_01930 [Planctomycetota bacterium]|nr:hypothetical protein [Planctomycetota bacterium]
MSTAFVVLALLLQPAPSPRSRSLPKEHPRLFGTAEQILGASRAKPALWQPVLRAAQGDGPIAPLRARTRGFASVVTGEPKYARAAIDEAMAIVRKGISVEHVEFEQRMWPVAETFDACFAWLKEDEQEAMIDFLNRMFDANNVPGVDSYVAPWHNTQLRRLVAFGLAGYATYPENPRALDILEHVHAVEWGRKLLPALKLYGAGGGWWEGRGYDTYSVFQFMTFLDVARRVEGVDLIGQVPEYFDAKCAHEMFSDYPGFHKGFKARRAAVSGDGNDAYGGFNELVRAARLILADALRGRPSGQALAAYLEATPAVTIDAYAVLDFLYKADLPTRPLADVRTTHVEAGPGTVLMRSSWADDAVWARFQCGDHFTWHQHYEQNGFEIFHGERLATTGGVFGRGHDTTYYIRSVAHNTILVYQPGERWTSMRDGRDAPNNDGGQAPKWGTPHTCPDVETFRSQKARWETGDLLAAGTLGTAATYVCGDATAAYAPSKMRRFVRHFLFLRPYTFVVLDLVQAKPGLKTTWVLNTLSPPKVEGTQALVTADPGRLHVNVLLPESPTIRTVTDFSVDGKKYPPSGGGGVYGQARLEVESPDEDGQHVFLTVLSTAPQPLQAKVEREGALLGADVGGTKILFSTSGRAGGKLNGRALPDKVQTLKP